MTGKERAALKSLAMTMDPVAWIGKSSLTPEVTASIDEALTARELIKVSVLQNCADDPHVLAQIVAERTGSQVVQVIGKKIVLYKPSPEKDKAKKAGNAGRKPISGKKPAIGRKIAPGKKTSVGRKPVFGKKTASGTKSVTGRSRSAKGSRQRHDA